MVSPVPSASKVAAYSNAVPVVKSKRAGEVSASEWRTFLVAHEVDQMTGKCMQALYVSCCPSSFGPRYLPHGLAGLVPDYSVRD